MPRFFHNENLTILFSGPNSPKSFTVLSTNIVPDLNSLSAAADGCRVMPFYDYNESGERVENVTDWALGQFQKHYRVGTRLASVRKGRPQGSPQQDITKEDIFHYVYAVLHHPSYRVKYEINLKREFPRIPFYEDFWKWAEWGKRLMELHLNYETVEAYPLERETLKVSETFRVLPRLMARKDKGEIEIDSETVLRSIPAEAWEYRLGTYSALEWILERYKEKKPKDPTIAEKFNTYKFAEYKEQVIGLLMKVCTVSVETMRIVREMPE